MGRVSQGVGEGVGAGAEGGDGGRVGVVCEE